MSEMVENYQWYRYIPYKNVIQGSSFSSNAKVYTFIEVLEFVEKNNAVFSKEQAIAGKLKIKSSISMSGLELRLYAVYQGN